MNFEGLVELYKEQLQDTEKPHEVLVRFYTQLNSVKETPALYQMFVKFVRLYGRNAVFQMIIETSWQDHIDFSKPNYGLFNAYLKRSLEKSSKSASVDLNAYAEMVRQERKKILEEREVDI